MTAKEIRRVEWHEVETHAQILADYVRENIGAYLPGRLFQHPKGIVGVIRGGLPLAVLLSHKLQCRRLLTVRATSYHQGKKSPTRINAAPSSLGTGAGYVVVDDLVDSGDTMRLLQQMWPEAMRVCMFGKPAGQAADVAYFVEPVPQETWLAFPWEG